ncbi:MAG: GNAT family N-acetyltransferase [Arenimonas sp.]|uniref:GNAT family N-acetyltransferase n=1 Tax=Arenimonas sp. TaxID=1872635 RepID=UPI0025BC94C7|nr:GNAT family N-acetyltransferase [Arenimonas sp.]MBW8367474.1 GNAT family N-acetyltransferase [Arenimonas sp.]
MIPSDFRVDPADYHADLEQLRHVRETVFVAEQQVPIEEEWDELDPHCRHVIARDLQNRPIGTGRLTPEHKIGRMAVLREWRGRGVGDALLVALIDQARTQGWTEVSLNAQVSAESFYARHGFEPYGPRFMEAGIEHQAMRRTLQPMSSEGRVTARPRGPSQPLQDFSSLHEATAATIALVQGARREIRLYSRDLEPVLYAQPEVLDAFRQFAIAGRGGIVQLILQDPAAAQGAIHPLLTLAQRMTSVFQFRTPVDAVDLQDPSAFLVNDRDGYLFRGIGTRFEGDWSPALPSRNRQLSDHFGRVWERSRACTELRALGI